MLSMRSYMAAISCSICDWYVSVAVVADVVLRRVMARDVFTVLLPIESDCSVISSLIVSSVVASLWRTSVCLVESATRRDTLSVRNTAEYAVSCVMVAVVSRWIDVTA